MNNFLIKTIYFFLALLCFVLLVQTFREKAIIYDDFSKNEITKRNELFLEFIKGKKSINLILGSSIAETAINPTYLGPNWFSFANPLQNIYESYTFIEFYKDSIHIDTIITFIQPFDFTESYINDRAGDLPVHNGEFNIFKTDSITNLKSTMRKRIQKIREKYLPEFDYYILNQNKIINTDIWSPQGIKVNNHTKLSYQKSDSIENIVNYDFNDRHGYFYNVSSSPNMNYFDIYNNLISELCKEAVYVQPPLHSIYQKHLKKYKDDVILKIIEDKLIIKGINFWNYKSNKIHKNIINYTDMYHMSEFGRRKFSHIIKNRLKSKKSFNSQKKL